jgi:hypothetical protein
MTTIKLSYSGIGGSSKFVQFELDGPMREFLEGIGHCTATGRLYVVPGVLAIPGRRIELIEMMPSSEPDTE